MLPARPASRAGARTHARALCLFLLPWLLPLLAVEAVRADYVPGALLHAEDFQSYGDGDDPAQWLDTGANNSLVEEPAVFETTVLGDGNVVFGTSSHRRSTHSHFAPPGSEGWSAYQVSGRMFPGSDQAGIGVSIYSGFGDSADYYRLMHDRSAGFHLAGLRHDCQGNTDTGTPVDSTSWYRFRLQAFPDGQGTRLRARVWRDGDPEPTGWPASCIDNRADLRRAGRFGLWSKYGSADKYWDDLEVRALDRVEYATEHVWLADYWVHQDLLRPTDAETRAVVADLAAQATEMLQAGNLDVGDAYCPLRFEPRRVLVFGPDEGVDEAISIYSFRLPEGAYLYPNSGGSVAVLNGSIAKIAVGPGFSRTSGDWALAHEFGHNAGLDHTGGGIMVGALLSGSGVGGIVAHWQCDAYLARSEAEDSAACLLYDAARADQGLDAVYPAPRFTPCADDSGYCDGGICQPTRPACFGPEGAAPRGTDCSTAGLCMACTGTGMGRPARCVPCDTPVGDTRSGVCGNGVRAGAEACDDGNVYDGDGCDSRCRSAPLALDFLADRDGDGVLDWLDTCPEDADVEHYDSDGDGLGDGCDACPDVADPDRQKPCSPDRDADGIPDMEDHCPELAASENADPDRDWLGDACDNCPDWSNPGQRDRSGNGVGDLCLCGDSNGSGTLTTTDATTGMFCLQGRLPANRCDPTIMDTDGDGIFTSRDAFRIYSATYGSSTDSSAFSCRRRQRW